MGDRPGPPAEARLIRERRESMVPRMSVRRAATLAARSSGETFAEATWRKIETGTYEGPADRIVLMALVVGITPDELDEAGRPDAAQLLRQEIRRRAGAEPALSGVDPDATPEKVIQMIFRALEQIREAPSLTEDQKRKLEASLIVSVKANLDASMDQIRTTLEIASEKVRS